MIKTNRLLRFYLIPLFVVLYSLWDLRFELRLLFDHLTLISLLFALRNHPISFAALTLTPIYILRHALSNRFKNSNF